MNRERRRRLKRRILSIIVKIFAWVGGMILYYALFSMFFDTPIEYEIRSANNTLEEQHNSISSRLDSLQEVLDNVSDRDDNVYGMLFEANPSGDIAKVDSVVIGVERQLIELSNRELSNLFFDRLEGLEAKIELGTSASQGLEYSMIELGDKIDRIPSIQPVVNKDLTKFAASYGMRIQPFFKSVILHEGVDFALPEDSRIYATADGTITKVSTGTKGEGLTIEIDHKNSYKTLYSHLNKALVRRGNIVKRGEIIAYSGNSGLSFWPHLHYSVEYKGVKVDPINYFYYELTPSQNRELKELAQLLMQSLD